MPWGAARACRLRRYLLTLGVGRPDLELRVEGVVWRFRNEGDPAAFADHPEVYTPRFDGYDPVAIARGQSVPAHPFFWAVTGERLYLFYSADARAAFLADPGRIIARRAHGPKSRAPTRLNFRVTPAVNSRPMPP